MQRNGETHCVPQRDLIWGENSFKDTKGYQWVFGIAAVETEATKKLNTFPGLPENPSAVGLLKVEE